MSDAPTTPHSPTARELIRTAGPTLNAYSAKQLAEVFMAGPNFDVSLEDAAVRIAQITTFTGTFDADIRRTAPNWIDMDKFIIVTSGFASNPKFWGKIFDLSARHHRYLRGELTIPAGQESDYEEAHSPEKIAENNSAFFGYAVILLATAALYGNTMDAFQLAQTQKTIQG